MPDDSVIRRLLDRLPVRVDDAARRRRVYLLIYDVGGVGGVARTVLNVANHLAADHEVEVISVFRRRKKISYPVDERVRVRYVEDQRPRRRGKGRVLRARDNPRRHLIARKLDARPARRPLLEAMVASETSLLTDLKLELLLRSLRPGIMLSTRPMLHVAAARYTSRSMIVVAQEHISYGIRMVSLRNVTRNHAHHIDALVALTETDAAGWREWLAGTDTVTTAIPNSLPWPIRGRSALDSKVIVAAGRLVARKGFDRLIEAFTPVGQAHPDWQLHIYGNGDERPSLTRLVQAAGMEGQIRLAAHTPNFEDVLARASMFAMASHYEGLPMVLIEAMSKGLPLVSFDIDGPRDVIRHDDNGLLVPDGDIPAFTSALRRLVEDDELRQRMGAAAHRAASAYDAEQVTTRWTDLFDQLAERRAAR